MPRRETRAEKTEQSREGWGWLRCSIRQIYIDHGLQIRHLIICVFLHRTNKNSSRERIGCEYKKIKWQKAAENKTD